MGGAEFALRLGSRSYCGAVFLVHSAKNKVGVQNAFEELQLKVPAQPNHSPHSRALLGISRVGGLSGMWRAQILDTPEICGEVKATSVLGGATAEGGAEQCYC